MFHVGFYDQGYVFIDEGNNILFSSDNSHSYLFDYIKKDLSVLSNLIEHYISKRMDIETFEIKDYQDDEEIIKIIEILQSAHPYFKNEKICRDTIINEIGNYFNHLLIYNRTQHTLSFDITKDWHIERIRHLMSSPLLKSEIREDEFYRDYQNWMGETDGDAKRINMEPAEETVFLGLHYRPKGFGNEIDTQRTISNMLYFLLDIDAADIGKLSTSQRIWLYSKLFNDNHTIEVNKQLLLFPPKSFGECRGSVEDECKEELEPDDEINSILEPLHSLCKLNVERDGFPKNLNEPLKAAIQYALKTSTNEFYEQYEVYSLQELLYLEIILMIQNNVMIRKCKNCGKYFVVANRKIAFCNRRDDSGNICSVVGSKRTFQRKMDNDEPLKLYNRAYKTHHARIQSGKIDIKALDKWRDEAKEKLSKVRSGELDIATFQEWLKK